MTRMEDVLRIRPTLIVETKDSERLIHSTIVLDFVLNKNSREMDWREEEGSVVVTASEDSPLEKVYYR